MGSKRPRFDEAEQGSGVFVLRACLPPGGTKVSLLIPLFFVSNRFLSCLMPFASLQRRLASDSPIAGAEEEHRPRGRAAVVGWCCVWTRHERC